MLNRAVTKVTKFCTFLKSTCDLNEAFECGVHHGVPSAVAAQCYTGLHLVKAVIYFHFQSLSVFLDTQGHKDL